MPTTKSKVTQQVEVGDGLTLGVLASGIVAMTVNKQAIDFAFLYAWRRWSHASDYPQVHGSVERNDLYYQIIGRSAARKWKYAAWQRANDLLHPYVWAEGDTPEEAMELLAESSDVPAEAWMELAELFLGHLKDDKKFRQVEGPSN